MEETWSINVVIYVEVNDIKEPERKIKISPLVISIFEKYIQKGCGSLEAGGIIIGKENLSNNDLVFVSATEPLKRDIRRKYRFHRKDKGHVTLFNRIYDESRQIHRYIGEWHTHPEKIPNYSGIDLKNWERIAKDLKNVEYFYHVIIGIDAYRIWQYDKDGKITLINTFYWKEHKLDEKNN